MGKRAAVLVMSLLGGMLGTAQLAGQVVDPGNSPAENLRARSAHRPGLRVQAGIARHSTGADISRQETPDPEYRLIVTTELVRNLFAQINVFIGLLPGLLQQDGVIPGVGGGGNVNDIVMTEIAHDGNVAFVELLNRSPLRIPLDGWVFSDGTIISPSLPPLEIERNMTLVVQLGGETQNPRADLLIGFRLQSINAGELALYDFSRVPEGSMPIEDPNLMIDYIQWNDQSQRRDPPLEQIAAAANLWTTIDAIPFSLANMTFRLQAGAEGRDSSSSRDFIVDDFAANSLGVPESQVIPEELPPLDTGDDRNIRDRLR